MAQIHALCKDDAVVLTQHLLLRCHEREIKVDDIMAVILRGEIIEQYPTDYPYPSCLMVYGLDKDKYLHVVAGIGENRLWIITAYHPDKRKWDDRYRTRKADE